MTENHEEEIERECKETAERLTKVTTLLNEFGIEYEKKDYEDLSSLIIKMDDTDKKLSIDFWFAGRTSFSLNEEEE